MKKILNVRNTLLFVLISALLTLTACGGSQQESASAADMTDVKIATVTWIGYSGLWLAEDLGYFEEEGIKLDSKIIEDSSQIKSSLASGQIDGLATTIDSIPRHYVEGLDVKTVFALDQSYGADGIVAKNEIESIGDLKGKDVAVEVGNVSEWFLANVLASEGLTLEDINIKEMTSSEAGAAFVSGNVDAAVTWGPWLSNSKDTDFGKVLVDSSQFPDIIVDVFGFSGAFVEENPEAVDAFIKAYDRGVAYLHENPEESYEILAKRINGEPADAEAQLAGLKIMSASDSKEFFGTADSPGKGYELAEVASDFWMEKGVITEDINIDDVKASIDPSFVSNY